MITDAYCAELCAAIYRIGKPNFPDFPVSDPGDDDGVCWAIERTADGDIIVLRGSSTFEDWLRDLVALASPFSHHALGPVHPGFLLGMEHAWSEIKGRLSSAAPPVVTGHSLGAARASILCGLMALDGRPPKRRVCFGEPKPGFSRLASILVPIPGASYRCGSDRADDRISHDLVTDVPISFPPEEYVHPTPLVHVPAVAVDYSWGMFSYHHIELYVKALGGNL
jgi:Lipase (class 3)